MSTIEELYKRFENMYPFQMDNDAEYHNGDDYGTVNMVILNKNLDLVNDTLINIININESQDFDATQKQLIIRELLDKLENGLQ